LKPNEVTGYNSEGKNKIDMGIDFLLGAIYIYVSLLIIIWYLTNTSITIYTIFGMFSINLISTKPNFSYNP